jgi:cytochrome c peroxidase
MSKTAFSRAKPDLPLSASFARPLCAHPRPSATRTASQKRSLDCFLGNGSWRLSAGRSGRCRRAAEPGEEPLFTDFTASNIGTPANPLLPYYAEGVPDARGYVANPSGKSFVDLGVGGFLANGHPLSNRP